MSYGGLRQVADLYNESCAKCGRKPGRLMCSYFCHFYDDPQQEAAQRARQIRYYKECVIPAFPGDPKTAPPSYRYSRGGGSYETNEYGANTLRQAVNYGYEEGFRAGKADRDDRWSSNYKDSYAYRDANYGYSGYYVERSDYNHYFRGGFRRGYEDSYNSRYQYGRFADGNTSILETILSQILNFQALR